MVRFHFEAEQRGRRVSGRICARSVFGAMKILRMTGMQGIHIRELEGGHIGGPSG